MGAMTYLGNYCAKSLQGVLKTPCGFRNSRVCSNHKEDHVNEMYKKIDDCKAQNSEDSDQSQLTYFPTLALSSRKVYLSAFKSLL